MLARKRSVFMSVATTLIAGQCAKMMINIFNSLLSFFFTPSSNGINFDEVSMLGTALDIHEYSNEFYASIEMHHE
jgi:hypothetical protein